MPNNDMKTCPYCAEDIRAEAIKCRYCGSALEPRQGAGEWYRDRNERKIAGVSSGLARQFGISATAIRVAFVIATFVGGWGLLIYLVLWVIMPIRPEESSLQPPAPPPAPEVARPTPVEPEVVKKKTAKRAKQKAKVQK